MSGILTPSMMTRCALEQLRVHLPNRLRWNGGDQIETGGHLSLIDITLDDKLLGLSVNDFIEETNLMQRTFDLAVQMVSNDAVRLARLLPLADNSCVHVFDCIPLRGSILFRPLSDAKYLRLEALSIP